jgi:hypothetical protein
MNAVDLVVQIFQLLIFLKIISIIPFLPLQTLVLQLAYHQLNVQRNHLLLVDVLRFAEQGIQFLEELLIVPTFDIVEKWFGLR